MKWVAHLVTGKDNTTHDLGRWSWILSLFTIIGHSIYMELHNITVDLVQLSTAISAVVASHGAALLMKKDTEPQE